MKYNKYLFCLISNLEYGVKENTYKREV